MADHFVFLLHLGEKCLYIVRILMRNSVTPCP